MINLLLVLVALFLPVKAETVSVSPSDDLQTLIDAAEDGDVFNLSEGTYTGALNLGTKSIAIIGVGDASIIDGNAEASTVTCSGGNSTIQKVKITGGSAANGGGIYLRGSCSLQVKQSTISGNSASETGSAICDRSSERSDFDNNIISFNLNSGSSEPHTVYLTDSKSRFTRNTIVANAEPGNGIFVTGSASRVRLVRNIVANNGENGVGRGICVVGGAKFGKVRVQRNILFDNSASAFFINGNDVTNQKAIRRFQRRLGGSRFSRNRQLDPQFTLVADEATSDFSTQEGSKAENFGAFSGDEPIEL